MRKLVIRSCIFFGTILLLLVCLSLIFRNTIINATLKNQLEQIGVLNPEIETDTYLENYKLNFVLKKFAWKGNELHDFRVSLDNFKKEENHYLFNLKNASLDNIKLNLKSLEGISFEGENDVIEDKDSSFKFKVTLNSFLVKNFLISGRKANLHNLTYNSENKLALIEQCKLDGDTGFIELQNIKANEKNLSFNVTAEDFSPKGYFQALNLEEIKIGKLKIHETNLEYNINKNKLNSNFYIKAHDPNSRVFNFFRKILSLALNKKVEFNENKNAYLEAKGEIINNIIILKSIDAKHNLVSFIGDGKIDLEKNDIKIYVKVKGIEQFVPIESLKLDYIIPSNLIPLEVSGQIEKPKVNVALTKVISTVEPKLIEKVRKSLFSIFSKDSLKQEKIEKP